MDRPGTKIITYDHKEKEHILPQCHIQASRVLHTKQQWQLFKEKYKGAESASLFLKTISSDKLTLFSDALNAKKFADFFKALGCKKQRQLIRVAGEKELDSPALTIKLVNCCLAPEWIERINSYIPTTEATDHLRYLIILDNCEQKNFVQKRNNYFDNGCMVHSNAHYYKYLPKILAMRTNFCGFTPSISFPLPNESDDIWRVNNFTNNANKILYFLTPTEPTKTIIEENKKRLWALFTENKKVAQKIIQHTNIIQLSAFSKNGKYLATSSAGPLSELILTNLTLENDAFAHPDLFLTGCNEEFEWISFNNQSTLLMALAEKKLYFWDVTKQVLIGTFDCSTRLPIRNDQDYTVDFISFNNNDSRLAIAFSNDELESAVTL